MSNKKDRSLTNPKADDGQVTFEKSVGARGAYKADETIILEAVKTKQKDKKEPGFDLDASTFVPDRHWREQLFMFLIVIGLLASSTASFVTMRNGLVIEWSRTVRDTGEHMFQSTMICGIISLCLFISWFATFSLGPKMLKNWAGFSQFMMAVLFTLFITVMSSLMNAAYILYPNVMPLDMIRQTNIASTAVDNLTVSLIDAKGFVNGSAGLESDACNLSDREEAGGFVSGTGAGFGKASAQLSSACSQIRGLRKALTTQISDAETKAGELSKALRDLRHKVEDPDISLLDREQELRTVMANLEMMFREYRNAGLARTVESGIATLKSAVPSVDASSGLNAATISVINGLSSKFASAASDLERVRAAGAKAAEYTPLEYRSLTMMVLEYAHLFPSQILMSAFLDIWPLFVFVFLLLVGVGKMKWSDLSKQKNKGRSIADDIKAQPVDPRVVSLLKQPENKDKK